MQSFQAQFSVRVKTPGRLHFGMLSFGDSAVRQFGGVGAMIDSPSIQLTVQPAERLEVVGPLCRRVREVAGRWARFHRLAGDPALRIEIESAGREHIGLGVGTQLSLAVVAGLCAACGRSWESAVELAKSAGRGLRSAVGSHGFVQGGLIYDPGKFPAEDMAPLQQRVELPASWRFVLICPKRSTGLSGEAEQQAFARLPPVPENVTAKLTDEIESRMLPAATAGRFSEFGDSVYQYGHAAGMCFAGQQAGPFASAETGRLVQRIRELGVRGVGQSSWGPSVFALQPGDAEASALVSQLESIIDPSESEFIVARPDNNGAQVQVEEQLQKVPGRSNL